MFISSIKKCNLYYICLIVIVLLLVQSTYNETIYELVLEPTCRKSTISNPMGNLLPYDPNPSLKACSDQDDLRVDNLFNGFLRDQDDDINKEKLNPFITLPVTNIEGMKTEFANFLLNKSLMCKNNGNNCEKYKDVRFSF